jgi:hypothetical protein
MPSQGLEPRADSATARDKNTRRNLLWSTGDRACRHGNAGETEQRKRYVINYIHVNLKSQNMYFFVVIINGDKDIFDQNTN